MADPLLTGTMTSTRPGSTADIWDSNYIDIPNKFKLCITSVIITDSNGNILTPVPPPEKRENLREYQATVNYKLVEPPKRSPRKNPTDLLLKELL